MAEQIIVLDEQKMLDCIRQMPEHFETSWVNLWTKNLGLNAEGIENVLLAGMGGSGIAGQLMIELMGDNVTLPVVAWQDYGLPAWVNDKTLVVATSYSGDTEETVDVVKKAVERQARVVAITRGGKLTELSQIHGFPVVGIDFEGQPRAAIGWLYGSLITLLSKLELISVKEGLYFQALDELRKSVARNIFPPKAEELAMSLSNKVPIVLAHRPLSSLAKRWVNQFNENSKTFAFTNAVPEACHNTIVGTEYAIPEKLMILYLESKYGFSRNNARQKVLSQWYAKQQIPFVPLSVKSGSVLAEQWLLLYFGDLLSYYLAGVYGVDPTPIEPIKYLKEELNKL